MEGLDYSVIVIQASGSETGTLYCSSDLYAGRYQIGWSDVEEIGKVSRQQTMETYVQFQSF